MKLKRFLLRYYPPGIILEYVKKDGTRDAKEIDLLHLTPETEVEVLVNQIIFEEPLISKQRKPQLRRLIYKLIEKQESHDKNDFYLSVHTCTYISLLPCTLSKNSLCLLIRVGTKFCAPTFFLSQIVHSTRTGTNLSPEVMIGRARCGIRRPATNC